MHQISIIDNFIEQEDIDLLINEINNPSETNPYPDYYSNRNGGTCLPYNDKVVAILKKYGKKSSEVHRLKNNLSSTVYTTKGYSSKWKPGSVLELHIDDVDLEEFIEYSTVIYLNAYPEYNGGKIYFPEKNFEYEPVKGSAVFFPQKDKRYIHGVTEIKDGYRYTLLFHHSSNIEFADPDLI